MELGRPRGACKALRLEQVSVPRLLFALLHQRFTGVLELDQPDPPGRRTVWFRGGMPIFTDWISHHHLLGEVLLAEGLVSADQLAETLQAMPRDGARLGPTLVQRGVLTPHQLWQGLRRQCARKMVELFELRGGEVLLTAGDYEAAPDATGVNVLALIAQGVATHYDPARVLTETDGALTGALRLTDAAQRYLPHFRFARDAEPLLARLAGGSDLESLARMPGTTANLAAQTVFILWACKMVQVGAAPTARASHPSSSSSTLTGRTPVATPPRRPTPTLDQLRAAARPTLKEEGRPAAHSSGVYPSIGGPAISEQSMASVLPSTPTAITRPTSGSVEAASNDESTFLRQLEQIEQKIAAKTHAFGLLGVDLNADRREIRRAFGEASQQFHPDALQARGLGHHHARVSQVFAALSEAQSLLVDPAQRDHLRRAIEQGVSPDGSSDATAIARAAFESELIAKEADKLLNAGRFDRALEAITRARVLTPDEPDLQASELWCKYQLAGRDRQTAGLTQAGLSRILKDTPKLARARYFLGLVFRDLGSIDAAIAELTTAAQLDPRNIDAERQARGLRLVKQQQQQQQPKAPTAKGGFFRRRG